MTDSRHAEKVEAIARSLRTREPGLLSLHKAGVSHMMPMAHDARRLDGKVDLSGLNEILAIDPAARRATVEPGVTFSDLVRQTLRHGLIPLLVPELKTITLGGAVSGCSVESMSYRFGGFHDSALAYELVTGDGRILNCSPSDQPEIFGMLHGSYGSLGILTRIDFPLLPAKPFVRMRYLRFQTFEEFHRALREVCTRGEDDFVDAIVHARDRFVLCLGTMVDVAPYTHRYDGRDIFYLSTWRRTEDYLPLYDYFFRYDTDCHWLSRKVPGLENPWVRRAIGKHVLGSTRLLALSSHLAPLLQHGQPDVVVDCFIPESRFSEFYRFYEEVFDFFPLWIVPYRVPRPYPFLADAWRQRVQDELFIDCAIYGKPNRDPGIDYYRVLDDKLYELGALKALISRNTYSEARFWEIYSRERHAAAKAVTDPTGRFRDLYQKVHCRA